MKIVVFLGAGFSRAWDLPVMNEFFQHAKDSEHLSEEDKDFLRNLQGRAQKGVSMLQVRHDNLEDILSFCLAESKFGTGYPDESNDEYKKLCYILQKVYRQINVLNWEKTDGFLNERKKLFGIRERYGKPTYDLGIITTNYDVMAEFCLTGVGFSCKLPGEWLPINNSTEQLYTKDHGDVLLCKLHGSLNWYVDDENKNSFKIESALVNANYVNEEVEHKNIWLPTVSLTKYEPMNEPLLIPPTLFKMQTDPRFQVIWRSAGEMLGKADKLVFIGFSFPEADVHIRYFLAANLCENVDLRSIDIVDPDANAICERLRKSSFGLFFTNRLRPIQGKWQEIEYSINS
ncbi:MAG: hypothetical protein ACYS21_03850 [Planctomycetota bacterium]|jgi:hypothetical protein